MGRFVSIADLRSEGVDAGTRPGMTWKGWHLRMRVETGSYFSTPISRRYFCTPGWIWPALGAALTVLCGVVSLALIEPLHQRGVAVVQRLGEPVGDVVGQVGPRQDVAPRADRIHRLLLARIGAGRHGDGFQEIVLGADLRDLVGGEPDEASAGLHHRGEARPADAAAPQRRDPAVGHHQRAVAGLLQIMRLEILLAVEAEAVGDVAPEQGQPRRLGAPGDRLADQIAQATSPGCRRAPRTCRGWNRSPG